MKNFRGSALAAGVGTPESVPHELLGSSLHFYLRFKHRNFFNIQLIARFPERFHLLDGASTQKVGKKLIFHKINEILLSLRYNN